MGNTKENLQHAFAGESQANRMYLAFAEKARQEGFEQVAKFFRAAAESETVHALAHFRTMGAVNETAENLEESIKGEKHEYTTMYPEFVAKAKDENDNAAVRSFSYAMQVEEFHEGEFIAAKDAVEAGEDLPAAELHVCKVCGHVAKDSPPQACPVCGSPSRAFRAVE